MRADEVGRVRGEKVTPEGLGPRACLIQRPNFGPLSGERVVCVQRALASLTIRGDPEGKGVD